MTKQLGLFWAITHEYSQLKQENLGGEKNLQKKKTNVGNGMYDNSECCSALVTHVSYATITSTAI